MEGEKIIINEEQISKSVNQFIQIINKGPFKCLNDEECCDTKSDYIVEKSGEEYRNIYQCAVSQAWLDMCRTTDGDEDNSIKDYFSNKLKDIFEGNDSFNLNDLIYSNDEQVKILTVGQRQKIVNMSCKYLYCCEDIRTKERAKTIFKTVDMPLDSFILEWFARIVVKWCEVNNVNFPGDNGKFIKGNMCEWSNLNEKSAAEDTFESGGKTYYSYSFIQKRIADYIEKSIESDIKLSSLEVEFLVWPEICLLEATENFLFSIKQYSVPVRREIRNKSSINENVDKIIEMVKETQCSYLWFN